MSRLALIPVVVLAAVLAGCGTPSQPLPMTVSPAEALQIRAWVPEPLRGQVAIGAVQGGMETGRWWGSKVGVAALQQALEESLQAVGMQPSSPEPAPRFELRAELLQLEQPMVPALGVTVGAAVRYTLVDTASGKVVYQRRIANTEEAGLGEAVLSPSERLRIANERALRGNINLLLRELVTLRP
jgi:hypothetical protein